VKAIDQHLSIGWIQCRFIHMLSASARVLEKCGFQQEGFLRKHFLKDGQYIDGRLFGLLR
jgi:hypothetical protein